MSTTPPKTNYLNNRDILKEIHRSKSSYCCFIDPATDHQYDIILPDVKKINRNTIAQARRNQADRMKKEKQLIIDPKKIAVTDLVFRISCWDHIPLEPPKAVKTKSKKIRFADILDFDYDDNDLTELEIPDVAMSTKHMRVNFPPFHHYRLDENRDPYLVGKSHWKGDLENGEFSKTHGRITHNLALMFMKLCDRYAGRSNWRSYTYNDEMKAQALFQLTNIGLQFDESKSQNPFAYYTCCVTNTFTGILNKEKRNQNIRDDILELNGLNPSWTRQNQGKFEAAASNFYDE